MPKSFQNTLSVGLSGLLALGVSLASGTYTTAQLPNVLHEMVPHVVLPETIQYNKTAKNLPGMGYAGVSSPYVATYIAYPSYQVPPPTAFQSVGQSVYPVSPVTPLSLVSPKSLPQPTPKDESTPDDFVGSDFVLQGREVNLNDKAGEPIQLANNSEYVVPMLPKPSADVQQTGMFCQQPAKPPAAWAFSSPLFKVASVPAGWGGGHVGGINHLSPRGSQQHVGFQSVGAGDPAEGQAVPQGIPYSTFQMGRQAPEQGFGTQVQILPNGMLLLTMPPDHSNCGLVRCRTGNAPRMMLLPSAPAGFSSPQQAPQSMMMPMPAMNTAFGGMPPYMSMVGQHGMPQMQTVPMTIMTPMGPAVVGYQQVPAMPPGMNPMAMMNQFPQIQQVSMGEMAMPNMAMPNMAVPSPAIAAQVSGATDESSDETLQPSPVATNPMTLVATPFGYYAVQTSPNATQADAAAQHVQMQALAHSQMMSANPYAGLYATPYGYLAMAPQGQFGGYGMPMMNAGYYQPGMFGGGQGMTVSEMLQLMTFLNNNKQQRRARLADRLAERRENRRAAGNDPFTQLMQAWTTPYVAPDTTLRMPSRNAYPYGYFGVQALPAATANYGGYHNLYYGNTTYPGLY